MLSIAERQQKRIARRGGENYAVASVSETLIIREEKNVKENIFADFNGIRFYYAGIRSIGIDIGANQNG
jgi:hypothetical protein